MKNSLSTLLLCFFIGFFSIIQSQTASQKILEKAINKNNVQNNNRDVNKKIDSLEKIIRTVRVDTTKVKLYLQICELCDLTDNLKYSQPAIDLLDKLVTTEKDSLSKCKLLKWRYDAVGYSIFFYSGKEIISKQIELLKTHIKIATKYNDPIGITETSLKLADLYFRQGEMFEKLTCLQNGLDAVQKMNYYKGISRFLIQTAFFYAENKDTVAALNYLNKAIANEKLINDSTRRNRAYIIRGNLYRELGQYSNALIEYDGAIKGYTKIKDTPALIDAYWQIGNTYEKQKDFNKALDNFEIAEKMAQVSDDPGAIVRTIISRGDVLAILGRYEKAIETHKWLWDKISAFGDKIDNSSYVYIGSHLAKDYVYAHEFKNAKLILDKVLPLSSAAIEKSNLENLSYKADSALGNYKEALVHYQNYTQLQIKLNNAEVAKASTQQKFKSDYEKRKLADRAEQDIKDSISQKEKQQQLIITYAVLSVLLLLIVFSFLLFKRFRLTNKQKEIIEQQKHIVEEKHKEITDSINYAERIQKTFLASNDLLNQHLKNYFIYFKPKDVVSGDFYWADTLPNGNFILATADSTGHGVPGAIMSLLNITSLEKAIEHLSDPAEILNHTRQTIINRLKRDGSAEGGKDGMDCSLIVFDFKNKQLHIAAAHNPVWILRKHENGNVELIEIKPDKMPVGKHDRDQESFTSHSIKINEGDIIYTLTDGFPDQFGGDKGKKFMSKNLKDLLLANAELPMNKQKEILYQTFTKWVGSLEQVDDVTLIGIKI
ncbi:MAG: SpoIIE family protein phosphatase [Bacteroidia bacterium]|nr:SpoIIE family protein phosphatase [Bacteroidia bacterium]